MCEGDPELLFCENETNSRRLYGTNAVGFFKDGIRSGIGISSQSISPERSAPAAVAASGMIRHSTRSTNTCLPFSSAAFASS